MRCENGTGMFVSVEEEDLSMPRRLMEEELWKREKEREINAIDLLNCYLAKVGYQAKVKQLINWKERTSTS